MRTLAKSGEVWRTLANPQHHIHENLPDIHQSSGEGPPPSPEFRWRRRPSECAQFSWWLNFNDRKWHRSLFRLSKPHPWRERSGPGWEQDGPWWHPHQEPIWTRDGTWTDPDWTQAKVFDGNAQRQKQTSRAFLKLECFRKAWYVSLLSEIFLGFFMKGRPTQKNHPPK